MVDFPVLCVYVIAVQVLQATDSGENSLVLGISGIPYFPLLTNNLMGHLFPAPWSFRRCYCQPILWFLRLTSWDVHFFLRFENGS